MTRRPGRFEALLRRYAPSGVARAGLAAAVLLAAIAVLAPLLAPHPWSAVGAGPPRTPPGAAFWFGTDELGRDVLSRCLYGARVSLAVGLVAVAVSTTFGTLVGAVAGYAGGWVDRALMFVTDLLLALPRLVLLLALLGLARLEGGLRVYLVVAVFGATGWMGVARIVRGEVLALKERDFVAAAVALGLSPTRILARHVVPNALAPVVVFASLSLGGTILAEAALSFLGLGVPPPTPTWGVMVADARAHLVSAPWTGVFPGLFVLWAVLSFHLVGDGLRDALDPRLRGRP